MIKSNQESTRKSATIFTVGYGGKKPREFAGLLKEYGVRMVVDVRLRPNRAAMGSFVLAKTPEKGIVALLAREGLAYQHAVMLAPTDEILDAWRASQKSAECWERYETQFIPLLAERHVESLFDPESMDGACLLCGEAKPDMCHRRLVAEYLRDRWAGRVQVEIIHILGSQR